MEKKKELLKPKNDIVFQSLFTQKNEKTRIKFSKWQSHIRKSNSSITIF